MISGFRFCIENALHSSFRSYSMAREARIFQKLFKKGLAPKKPNVHKSKVISKRILSSPFDNEPNNHRMVALNKMYMEHIVDMMSDGEYCRKLADYEIEVTKVRLSNECNFLNIYFISKKTDTPEETLNETLTGALAELQNKMGEIRFMGRVPYLRFVRDKMLESAIQVEKIFQVMDFGRDYQPVNAKKVCNEDLSERKDSMPKMRQDVFGLDVAKIKGKIEADILRFKAINIETPESDFDVEHEIPHKLMTFNKKDFIKFFKRRRIAELKRRKAQEREMTVIDFGYYGDDDDEEEENYYDDDEEML